jgi:15-cis-phytoene synthase
LNSITANDYFSEASMQQHGRTFYWASFLLGASRPSVMKLYRLCRYVDDMADKACNPQDAKNTLDELNNALLNENIEVPFVYEAMRLNKNAGLPKAGLLLLIKQVSQEYPFKQPRTEADLLEYAFGVAGSVGYMMRPILGCEDANADRPAVALGIAMQLTNIARDIGEDARAGRLYTPTDWALSTNFSQGQTNSVEASRAAHLLALQLLKLAERFYAYAEDGIFLLPWSSRLAVRAALQMYRAIGEKIKVMAPEKFLQTRAYVAAHTKCWLFIRSLLGNRVTATKECASSLMWPPQVEKALQELRQHEQ